MAAVTSRSDPTAQITPLPSIPEVTNSATIGEHSAVGRQIGHPTEQFEVQATDDHAPQDAAEDETQYPDRATTWLFVSASGLAIVLVSLNSQILATAIPHITDEFGTINDVGWYAAAYRLVLCAVQFMYGRVYKLWSLKRVFMISIVIFEVGSLLCGLSPTSAMLIAGRAVQGFGAAGIVSGSFSMLIVAVPLRKRPLYIGIISMIEEMFGAVAPLIGGTITDNASWRWCFYMNLPLGAFALLLIGIFYKDFTSLPDHHLPWLTKIKKLDLTGTAVLIPGMVALLFGLQLGGTRLGWGDSRVIASLIVSVFLIAAFVGWQIYKQDDATLPPRIMKQRSIFAGMWFAGCNNGMAAVVEYYLPIYFQTVREVSAQTSGLLVLPYIIAFTASLMCGGALTSWIGYWVPTMYFTSILTPIASGLLSTISVSGPAVRIGVYQAMLGLGNGLGFGGPQFAVQTVLAREDIPIGIACIQFAQNFGPAILIPAAQSLFTTQLTRDLSFEVPGLNATRLENQGLSDLRSKVQAGQLQGTILAFDKALMQTLYLPTAVSCVLIFSTMMMEWRSVKQKTR